MTTDVQIHGSVFLLLQKFFETTFGNEAWNQLKQTSGNDNVVYEFHKNYPTLQLASMIRVAAVMTGLQESQIKEKFGEFLVPDLLSMYKAYLRPEWKTFDLLQNTELVMHKAVRKEESKANPPVLNISRVHDQLIVIDYYSQRRLGSLAVGIINGIAKFYGEQDKVKVIPMTDPVDERVQIRVEFS